MNTLLFDENPVKSTKRSRRASMAIADEPEFADFRILEDKVILPSKIFDSKMLKDAEWNKYRAQFKRIKEKLKKSKSQPETKATMRFMEIMNEEAV